MNKLDSITDKINNSIKDRYENIMLSTKQRPYVWGLLLLVITILIIPIGIWISYFIGDQGIIFVHTSLTVGDALGFYGTFLSCVGSLTLGVITIVQNTRLTKENQEMREAEQRAQLPVLCLNPFQCESYEFETIPWKMQEAYGCDICYDMQDSHDGGFQIAYTSFSIKNISGFPVRGIRAIKCGIQTIGKINFHYFDPISIDTFSLGVDQSKSICVKLISQAYDYFGIDRNKIQINMTFECYNPQKRKCEFKIHCLVYNQQYNVFPEDIYPEYK